MTSPIVAKVKVSGTVSWVRLCDSLDRSPPGSPVHESPCKKMEGDCPNSGTKPLSPTLQIYIYIHIYIYIYIFTVWAIRETLDVSLVNVYLYLNYKYKYNIGLISLYFKQKTSSMKFPVMFLMPCQRLDIYLTLNSYFQNEWIQSTYTYLA